MLLRLKYIFFSPYYLHVKINLRIERDWFGSNDIHNTLKIILNLITIDRYMIESYIIYVLGIA